MHLTEERRCVVRLCLAGTQVVRGALQQRVSYPWLEVNSGWGRNRQLARGKQSADWASPTLT